MGWYITIKEKDKYKPGDNCYIIDANNKIKYCEVICEIKGEPNNIVAYQLQDLVDYRFITEDHNNCADSEKEIKLKLKKIRAKKNE